nr:MAG TPA: hypothetical protein [Caudoviricetes sp.]
MLTYSQNGCGVQCANVFKRCLNAFYRRLNIFYETS